MIKAFKRILLISMALIMVFACGCAENGTEISEEAQQKAENPLDKYDEFYYSQKARIKTDKTEYAYYDDIVFMVIPEKNDTIVYEPGAYFAEYYDAESGEWKKCEKTYAIIIPESEALPIHEVFGERITANLLVDKGRVAPHRIGCVLTTRGYGEITIYSNIFQMKG